MSEKVTTSAETTEPKTPEQTLAEMPPRERVAFAVQQLGYSLWANIQDYTEGYTPTKMLQDFSLEAEGDEGKRSIKHTIGLHEIPLSDEQARLMQINNSLFGSIRQERTRLQEVLRDERKKQPKGLRRLFTSVPDNAFTQVDMLLHAFSPTRTHSELSRRLYREALDQIFEERVTEEEIRNAYVAQEGTLAKVRELLCMEPEHPVTVPQESASDSREPVQNTSAVDVPWLYP